MATWVQAHALHVEVSRVVKAPRERVFSAYTDFKAIPRWSGQVTVLRVVGREGDTVHVERGSPSGGRPRVSAANLMLSPFSLALMMYHVLLSSSFMFFL
ncbi:MAG: SRPBCC family protein [Nitrososphaerales archaeon]|nr:SRPBCC family protein [Nitrososphaerales archaeon]